MKCPHCTGGHSCVCVCVCSTFKPNTKQQNVPWNWSTQTEIKHYLSFNRMKEILLSLYSFGTMFCCCCWLFFCSNIVDSKKIKQSPTNSTLTNNHNLNLTYYSFWIFIDCLVDLFLICVIGNITLVFVLLCYCKCNITAQKHYKSI